MQFLLYRKKVIVLSNNVDDMSVLDHLSDLRKSLVRAASALGIAMILVLFVCQKLFLLLQEPLRQAARGAGMTEEQLVSLLRTLAPAEIFVIALKIALFFSLILASPFIFHYIWRFVAPGLKKGEQKIMLPAFIFGGIFFLIGMTFCYAIVLPVALQFFLEFNQSWGVGPEWALGNYFDFVLKLLLAFGLVFEMPILSVALTRIGLLTPEFMMQKWREVVVGSFVLGAILTPPDVLTQSMMVGPLLVLYGVSILLSKLVRPKPMFAEDE